MPDSNADSATTNCPLGTFTELAAQTTGGTCDERLPVVA
jgi:hypothetical protein